MSQNSSLPRHGLEEDVALRTLLEGTAAETGERFFAALVQNLARALNTQGAWVTEYLEESRRLRALAFWMNGQWIHDFAYDVAGTPCESAIASGHLVHYPDNVVTLFPGDPYLKELGAVSYMGVRLTDLDGRILGLLAVLDARPIPEERRPYAIFQIFAARVPITLIESEFFGHERGAFTGATRRRDGRFALADGSTIFLDEIGELPIDVQGKLLRVLQEGEFELVGSSRTRKVDVRVIAASNRDLRRAVREGKFREDLYFRLSVFPIELPPLRERGDDIALLAAGFAERFARRIGRAVDPLSAACTERLKAYRWPGNVRELQNVIERAVITSEDGRLNLDRALPEISKEPPPAVTPPPAASAGSVRTMQDLRELERENLRRALETTGWRVAGKDGAASLLAMNPSTLTSRMKALGISRPR